MKTYLRILAVVLFAMAGVAIAQQEPVQLAPGVARVSLIHSDVSMQRGDSGDWVAATLNTPVVAGDQVSTGERSRGEIQLDFANILRMDSDATAKIANLTRTRIQVQVGKGLTTYSVLKGSEADAEIDTPNVSVHPLKVGSYRIQVNSDSETQVIVRKGEADVTTPQGSTHVNSGEIITIDGTDNPQYQTASAPHTDDWDKFNQDRDHLIGSAESWRNTNRYYTGSEDLDAYGHWARYPGYGSVWVPVQGSDWAPYRDGRWVWEPYYGWTWVSYEPWGWAPYHYGRWFLYDGSWCWWPGPVYGYRSYYPVWAPAYVSFFGFGFGHVSVGFGFGRFGWLPIGPGDGFYPWYGRRVNVVNVTNVTNITNITNINNINNRGIQPMPALLRGGHGASNLSTVGNNPRLLRAVSSMPADTFGKARVPMQQEKIDSAGFRQAGLLTGRVPVVPTHESLRPVDRAVTPSAAATGMAGNQRFFTKGQAAPAPKSFNEQAAQVQKMIGDSPRPGLVAETRQPNLAASNPAAQKGAPISGTRISQTKPTAASATAATTNGGNASNANGRQAAPAQTQPGSTGGADRPGWHSFGGGTTVAQAAGANQSAPRGSSVAGQSTSNGSNPRNAGSNSGSAAGQRSSASPSGSAAASPSQGSSSVSGGGWHRFGGSTGSTVQRDSAPKARPSTGPSQSSGRTRADSGSSSRGSFGQASDQGAASGGWHNFSRRSTATEAESPGGASASRSADTASANRGDSATSSERANWQRFSSRDRSLEAAQGSGVERSGRGPSAESSSSDVARPPLDLRQPIVTRRDDSPSRGAAGPSSGGYNRGGQSSGGYSGGSRGGTSGGSRSAAPASGHSASHSSSSAAGHGPR
jgi:hypothetical protein